MFKSWVHSRLQEHYNPLPIRCSNRPSRHIVFRFTLCSVSLTSAFLTLHLPVMYHSPRRHAPLTLESPICHHGVTNLTLRGRALLTLAPRIRCPGVDHLSPRRRASLSFSFQISQCNEEDVSYRHRDSLSMALQFAPFIWTYHAPSPHQLVTATPCISLRRLTHRSLSCWSSTTAKSCIDRHCVANLTPPHLETTTGGSGNDHYSFAHRAPPHHSSLTSAWRTFRRCVVPLNSAQTLSKIN